MTVVTGRALVLDEPLSLWGGMDPGTGRLIDPHHPQRGAVVTGRVVVMRSGKGSSSSASILAESVRAGTAPAAFLLAEPDLILEIGSAVAEELYGIRVPVHVITEERARRIADGAELRIGPRGGLGRSQVSGPSRTRSSR